MDARHRHWKQEVDALWSDYRLDHANAARVVAEIAQQDEKGFLQQAAAQALPSMRRAVLKNADQMTKSMARRRFGAVRDALHALTAPRFGKRGDADEPLDPDEANRRMLGLPAEGHLFGAEISRAFKRTAKKVHPDVGGSERAFREVSAARDALLKRK